MVQPTLKAKMKETEDIIQAFKQAQQQNKKTALATVVHVEGSSYRRPGARMLVTEDGELTGAISGGCLEGDALRKALLAINQWQNKLVSYDSMDDDDNSIGIQLGCNGIVHILFEPIDSTNENNPLALLEKAMQQRRNTVIVTLFSLSNNAEQVGTCLFTTGRDNIGYIADKTIENKIIEDTEAVLSSGHSVIKNYLQHNGQLVIGLIELIKPPVDLVIAGAGNDAFPLVQMASVLGWHVTIVDGRKTHANAKRFPVAKNIIVAKPAAAINQIVINEQTIFVLMSHNYNYDLAMLQQLVSTKCNYIGVLGPKKKLEKMFKALQDEGITINSELKQKIYGPVGLDIGAETAEEIALSITAEIKSVLARKDGTALRNKDGFIHEHYTAATITTQ